MGVGVLVEVAVGVGVEVGMGVEVGVRVAGAKPGRLQAWRRSTSINMVKSSFFMERTIHGRG
jgi:hypothetical protein